MGLSGYSSVHCPPGAPSESTRWQPMPRSPSSNTWNSPHGPAPMITTSVTIGGFGEVSDKTGILGSEGARNDNPARLNARQRPSVPLLQTPGAAYSRRQSPSPSPRGDARDQAQRQWQSGGSRRRSGHAAPLGAA